MVPPSGDTLSSTWVRSSSADLTVDNVMDSETGSTECFQISGGATDISWNISMVKAEVSVHPPDQEEEITISRFVFHDVNNNGYLEDGEDAIQDVQVVLFDCNGTI